VLEGFRFTGIEREAEYVAIGERRIAYWTKVARRYHRLLAYRAAHPVIRESAPPADPSQPDLFAEVA
jgi:DNA modification methylase